MRTYVLLCSFVGLLFEYPAFVEVVDECYFIEISLAVLESYEDAACVSSVTCLCDHLSFSCLDAVSFNQEDVSSLDGLYCAGFESDDFAVE